MFITRKCCHQTEYLCLILHHCKKYLKPMHTIKITISCHIAQGEDIVIRLYNVKHVVCLVRRFAGANDRSHLYRRTGIHWCWLLEDISIATATQATPAHYSFRQVDHTSLIVGTCASACEQARVRVYVHMFVHTCVHACMRMHACVSVCRRACVSMDACVRAYSVIQGT